MSTPEPARFLALYAQRRIPLSALLLLLLGLCACVRRDGRNANCEWPGENPKHPVDARHLSADAEFAEDLAIRYADTRYGIHSPNPSEDYGERRDECQANLFAQIAKEHGIPPQQVSGALGKNRTYIDVATYLPFALLYCIAAAALAPAIWRRYPIIENGLVPGVVMTAFLSVAVAAGCTLCGEQWGWVAETYRIGNKHMSYRADRLWWGNHRFALFCGAVIVFWLFGIESFRRIKRSSYGQATPTGEPASS